MAGLQVKLLLVLVLVLVLTVQGWEVIDEAELVRLYESGAWSEAVSVIESDDKDYDKYEDEVPEKAILEAETEGEVGSIDSFEVDEVDSGPRVLSKDDKDHDNYEDEVPEKTILEAETEGEVGSIDSFADNGFEVDEVDSSPRVLSKDKDDGNHEDEVPGKTILEAEGEVGSIDHVAKFGSEVDEVDSGPGILSKDDDDDDNEDEVPERTILEAETEGEVGSFDSVAENGFEVDEVDSGPRIWADGTSEFEVEFVDDPFTRWTESVKPPSANVYLVCSDAGFHITLLTGDLSLAMVLGAKKFASVKDAESCGFAVNVLENKLTVPFFGCNVKQHDGGYSLQLLHVDSSDGLQISNLTCKANTKSDSDLHPRGGRPRTCAIPGAPDLEPPAPPKMQNCAVTMGERLTCGYSGISLSECEKIGCCYCSTRTSCYYPLDECTMDQHFVFAIRRDSASIPVDPTKLVIPGNANCKPLISNYNVAIFKFKVTECGTRVYQVGEVTIYLAEVQTIVQVLNLKFGLITRSNPLRFLIECRYSKLGAAHPSLATVGYMVKTPPSSLPTAVISNGLYGVQLKIATDQTYQKFYSTTHQPLKLLLGKPVFLELRLKSPTPDAVILVNYCLAYPRSAKNALVLIYEGCANPYDPHVSILHTSGVPKYRHRRHFTVKAFQFMEQKTNQYLDEEIYFMCSAEVCRPTEKKCEERCFDGKTS